MARPQKCGMDYFPHDTDALTDEKIEALRMLYGNDGYAFYFILLERIYRTEYFELDISDAETIQILSRKIGITENLFHKMLATSLKRGCFDLDVFEERSCLTSNGIKKRADVVISKRKASKKMYEEKVSATETNQEINQETDTESTQSKGEERKGEKKEKNNTSRFTPPTQQNVSEYCNERRNGVDPVKWFNFYESKGWMVGKNKMKDWKAAVRTWEKNNESSSEQVKNKYAGMTLEEKMRANAYRER